jgi:hypothetical protein
MEVYGDADLADLAQAKLVVGVAAHLGGEVKGYGEAGLAVREKVLEAGVGLLGGAEARVLAHGPRPAAVHARVDTAGEGVLARFPELLGVVEVLSQVLGPIDWFDLDAGIRAPLVYVHAPHTSLIRPCPAILQAR